MASMKDVLIWNLNNNASCKIFKSFKENNNKKKQQNTTAELWPVTDCKCEDKYKISKLSYEYFLWQALQVNCLKVLCSFGLSNNYKTKHEP